MIHFYNDIDEWELYDLKEDPHELNNVYSDPAYAEVRTQMLHELDSLQVMYDDPIRELNPKE